MHEVLVKWGSVTRWFSYKGSVTRGFRCTGVRLHGGSVARWFSYTVAQLHGGSVTGVQLLLVQLHAHPKNSAASMVRLLVVKTVLPSTILIRYYLCIFSLWRPVYLLFSLHLIVLQLLP